MSDINFSNYIFSRLADDKYDNSSEILFQFNEEEIDYVEEMITQYSNFQNGNDVKVTDLINSQLLSKYHDRDLQMLISLLCMYRSGVQSMGGSDLEKRILKKNLSKIWFKSDFEEKSDSEIDKLIEDIFKNGTNFVKLCNHEQLSNLALDSFEQTDTVDSEEEDIIAYSSLS